MKNYVRDLQTLYPSQEQLKLLLPKADGSHTVDLRRHNLKCLGLIGSGSFSDVYRVSDKNGRHYAAKVTPIFRVLCPVRKADFWGQSK